MRCVRAEENIFMDVSLHKQLKSLSIRVSAPYKQSHLKQS